jgi:sulfur carrier protein ThiS
MVDGAEMQGVITLQCRLVGELRRFLPDGERGKGPVAAPAGSSVDDLLRQLELPERESLVVGVNGTKAEHGDGLTDGDEVTIVAAMTGGVG